MTIQRAYSGGTVLDLHQASLELAGMDLPLLEPLGQVKESGLGILFSH